MNSDDMPAGREMDALIHVRVFGASVEQTMMGAELDDEVYIDVPHYSTDIAAAWRVAERLRQMDIGIELSIYPDGLCEYWVLRRIGEHFEHYEDGQAYAAPFAICRAALKAMEGTNR